MRKLILMFVAVLALCGMARGAEPNEPLKTEGLTLWGLTADNADSLAIVGLGWQLNQIEPGFRLKYFTGNPKWGPAPDAVGFCLIYHVDEIGIITDPKPDNAWEEILHSLNVRPYGGIEIAIPTQKKQEIEVDGIKIEKEIDRKVRTNFMVGTLFSNDPTFKWAFVLEYIVGQGAVTAEDDWGVTLGARWRF